MKQSEDIRLIHLSHIVNFLHIAEHLKHEVRHSWVSNGRQESVAEHCWRLALMVLVLAPSLDRSINVEKCLKLALLHDVAEAETGDIPVFEVQQQGQQHQKYRHEQQAMVHITEVLGGVLGQEIYALWQEYEAQESYEAQVVRALDKVEVQLQHNEADLSTWLPQEKQMVFQSPWMKDYCAFDTALALLSELIQQQAMEKLQENNEDSALIKADVKGKEA